MKHIRFTEKQKQLLQELLNKRLIYYNASYYERSRKRLLSALNKINSQHTIDYTSNDKDVFISCVNEHYEDFLNELQLPTAFSWLTISNVQRKLILKIDDCKDILVNCGYFTKKHMLGRYDTEFRYGNFLSAVDKMKKSDKVFLSKVGENEFYKIGFVYDNKEYVPFELKRKVSWRAFEFISLRGEIPEIFGKQNFSLIATKPKAKELLATCESKFYPEGVLDFMNLLLN